MLFCVRACWGLKDTTEALSLSSICNDYPSFDQFVFLGYTAGNSLSMTLSAEPAAAPTAAAEGDAAADSAEPAAAPAAVVEGDASAEPAPAAAAEGAAAADSAEPVAAPAAAAEGDAATEEDAAPTAE